MTQTSPPWQLLLLPHVPPQLFGVAVAVEVAVDVPVAVAVLVEVAVAVAVPVAVAVAVAVDTAKVKERVQDNGGVILAADVHVPVASADGARFVPSA